MISTIGVWDSGRRPLDVWRPCVGVARPGENSFGSVVALVEPDPDALSLGDGKFGTEARLSFDPSGGDAAGLGQQRLPAATRIDLSLEARGTRY